VPLFGDIITTASDISEYVSAWVDQYARSHEIQNLSEDQERQAVHELCDHMYQNLSILDQKSNALVASNALTTGILAILAFSTPIAEFSAGRVRQIALFLLTPSLISLILSVTVISVYWSTTREITGQTGIRDRARSLLRLRSGRTLRYRIAYLIHLLVLCAALIIMILAFLKTAPL
jgi:hypothetical protein